MSAHASKSESRLSLPPPHSRARERLLEKASALFYAEGIRAVGVDRVVSEAKVTRATFYRHFPGKEDLVEAYLAREHRRAVDVMAAAKERAKNPTDLLEMILRSLADDVAQEGFRGCAFINATAEYPDAEHPVRRVVRVHRAWFLRTMREVLEAAGVTSPAETARALHMLRDGAAVGGYLDEAVRVRRTFVATARRLCQTSSRL